MTVGELLKDLKLLPKDAIVYIQSDHGQTPEQANFLNLSDSKELPYYGEDLDWDYEGTSKVTAILIS
jgi:hypothetical protein